MPTHRLIRGYCFNDRELTNTDLKQNWFYERRGRHPGSQAGESSLAERTRFLGSGVSLRERKEAMVRVERKSAWQPGERHFYTLADSLHKPTLGRESHKD